MTATGWWIVGGVLLALLQLVAFGLVAGSEDEVELHIPRADGGQFRVVKSRRDSQAS